MKHRKLLSSSISVLLSFLLLLHSAGFTTYGQSYPAQPEPEKLEIYPLYNNPPNTQPQIGYNEFDGYYADLRWNALRKPVPASVADNQYINIYLQEIPKSYQPVKPVVKIRENLPGDMTSVRLNHLKSGTVYYAYVTAYYTDTEEGSLVYTSPESLPSNTVKFLTDIEIDVKPNGPSQVSIIWDDVWNAGSRINYRLYISESSDFSNTPPLYISSQDIGDGKPVKVDKDSGKLVYNYTVRSPGRVYYIKIEPDILDSSLKWTPSTRTVAVSSRLLARTVKMAENEMGTIWRLDWTPVVTGLSDENIEIKYEIYRGIEGSGTLPEYVAATSDTTFFLTLDQIHVNYYFIIRAQVKKNGEDLYPGIKIESDFIYLQESEIPSQPAAPEIVNEVRNSFGDVIISFEERLKPDSAVILWRVPRTGTGFIDEDITYDIWLLENASDVNNPPAGRKIESALKVNERNFVMDGTRVVGYKYELSGLKPNSTYYFRIVARKDFIDYVDGVLQNITYYSEPTVKVIVTPTEGAIDRPVVPARPPLKIKQGPLPEENYMISESTVVVQLKNKWYEYYDSSTNQWEYIDPQELNEVDPGIIPALETGTYEGSEYRIVSYDGDVTIDVGCVKYESGMNPEDIVTFPANKVTGFPAIPNDPDEDAGKNPDGKKHNIDIIVSGLTPNTTYIIWVRASRVKEGLMSEPSDPLLVTTNPELASHIEIPVVPEINYREPGDTYVDLGWNITSGRNYYIKYATEDNVNATGNTVKVTSQELMNQSYYRITGLLPDTLYYFWIQAEAVNEKGETAFSEWSSSYPVRTLKPQPPATPQGFGLKNTDDAVTPYSLTFEWVMEEGLEYILEISENADYKGALRFNVGHVSEFKVENLRSNCRYFARLYAYDPAKGLESQPTASISVKTARSTDEYDSDEDVDTVPSGEMIEIDPFPRNGVWNARITGMGAARFIEAAATDTAVDYEVNLKNPPAGTKTIRLKISGRLVKALSDLKENLVVKAPGCNIWIKPDSFGNVIMGNYIENLEFEIDYILRAEYPTPERGMLIKTELIEFYIKAGLPGGKKYVINEFDGTIGLSFELNPDLFKSGVTMGAVANDRSEWTILPAHAEYSPLTGKGEVFFELKTPGKAALIDRTRSRFTDIAGSRYRAAIDALALNFELKSVQTDKFYPEKNLTLLDAVSLSLDILGAGSERSPMVTASRAGIISPDDVSRAAEPCTREKAIAIAVGIYEKIQAVKIKASSPSTSVFKDFGKVSPGLVDKIDFAVRNGLVLPRNSTELGPQDIITRGEFAAILEKVLTFAGRLQ